MRRRTAVVLSIFALLCFSGAELMAGVTESSMTKTPADTGAAAAETNSQSSVSFSNYILVLNVTSDYFMGGYVNKSVLEVAKGNIFTGQYKEALKDNSKDAWAVGDVIEKQFNGKYIVTNIKLEDIRYNSELSNNMSLNPEISNLINADYRMVFVNYQSFSGFQQDVHTDASMDNPPVRMFVYQQYLVVNHGKSKIFSYSLELYDSQDIYKVKDSQRREARYNIGRTIFKKEKALMKQIGAYIKPEE